MICERAFQNIQGLFGPIVHMNAGSGGRVCVAARTSKVANQAAWIVPGSTHLWIRSGDVCCKYTGEILLPLEKEQVMRTPGGKQVCGQHENHPPTSSSRGCVMIANYGQNRSSYASQRLRLNAQLVCVLAARSRMFASQPRASL